MLFLLGLVVAYQSIRKGTIEITFENVLLFATFFIYVLIDFYHHHTDVDYDYVDNFFLMIDSSIGYFIGFHLLKNNNQQAETVFKRTSFIIMLSVGLFAILGLIYKLAASPEFVEYAKQTEFYAYGRWGFDVWSNEVVYPTNFNNQFTFVMSAVFGIIFYIRNRIAKVLLGIVLFASVWSAFATSTRTNIYIIIALFGMGFLLDFIFNQKSVWLTILNIIKKYKMKIIFVSLLLITTFIIFWNSIYTQLHQSDLVARFSSLENESLLNGRVAFSLDVIRNISKYPFGNMHLYWAHNLWLDVARISGIIPMVLLLSYSLFTFISLLRLVKNTRIDIKLRLMSVTVFIGTYLAFSIEPIIEGRPHLWMLFCLFNGMVMYLSQWRYEDSIEQI